MFKTLVKFVNKVLVPLYFGIYIYLYVDWNDGVLSKVLIVTWSIAICLTIIEFVLKRVDKKLDE